LRVNDVAVAAVAGEEGCAVGTDLEFPDLEFFVGYAPLVTLTDRDRIQKPIGPGFVGDLFRAVGEQHVAVDAWRYQFRSR
jgi:hypothetical protein